MPLDSIQFWIVTVLAAGGVVVLALQFKPARKKRSKTQLTVSAKKRD